MKLPSKNKGNKLHAKSVEFLGEKFDSIKEKDYYARLLMMKKDRLPDKQRVVNIERQVKYNAIINGIQCWYYLLDFRVTYADSRVEHIDIKGFKGGATYKLFLVKKKVIQALYGIEIKEL